MTRHKIVSSVALLSAALATTCLPAMSSNIENKTLMAWVKLAELKQTGSGVLTLERGGGQFDSIVFGENTPRKWMAGSENWARTQGGQSASPVENAGPKAVVQIAIVYKGNQVSIYRNGQPYAAYTTTQPLTFPAASTVLIGKRHMDAGGTPFFNGAVLDARIYNTALTPTQIAEQKIGKKTGVDPLAWWCFSDKTLHDRMSVYKYASLQGGARIKNGALILNGKGAFMMARTTETKKPIITSTINYRPHEPGFVGDPIPFYWRGEYHVFYLKGGDPARSPWAHVVSKDLIHWKELPHALVPGDDKLGPDYEGIWTGSVVEHDGLFHIFYTGKNSGDPLGDQKVMHATSKDLITWEKQLGLTFYADGQIYWSKPVNGAIDAYQPYHHQAFRDPEVFWNEAAKKWWMLLHTCTVQGSKAAVGLYTSDDLMKWTPQQPVYVADYSLDCPHIMTMDGKWYIIAAGQLYTVSDQPGGPYRAQMVPYGVGLLEVPKGAYDGKRNIIWGWMWDQEGFVDEGDGKWGGTLSMAREIYAGKDGELHQRPVQEVVNYFKEPVTGLSPELEETKELKVPANYILHCQLNVEQNSVVTIGFRQQPGKADSGYQLVVNPATGTIELKNSVNRSAKFNCKLDTSKPIDVRAFVNNDIIECFINDAHAVSIHAYNYRSGQLSFNWNGQCVVQDLTVSTAGSDRK